MRFRASVAALITSAFCQVSGAGDRAVARPEALRAEGSIEVSGLRGTWSRDEDLSRGRWAVAIDVGVFRSAERFDGKTRWRQDPSGGVHPLNGAFAKRAAATEAWLTRRAWEHGDRGGARIGRGVTRSEHGRAFTVLEAVPRGGQPVELWFDASSGLLARTVRTMPISILTVSYSDYRSVGGLHLPFTIESRDSTTSDVEVIHVDRWVARRSVSSAAFAAPVPPDDTDLNGETTVPLEIDGLVTIEAKLNGRPLEFILDTGGHNIITPDVARALGVHPVGAGATGGSGTGELAQQYVRIDRLEIGAATMRDQHFYVIPFPYSTVERGQRPPLAGLIGLEVFERFAVRVDYPGKTLTLRKFSDGPQRHDGHAVPITFDDDMPLLPGHIDGVGGLFALDIGNAGTTVLQHRWVAKHGMAERLKRGVETVSYGAGGASRNWASRADTLEVGGSVFKRPIVRYAEDQAGAFSSRTEAANIGTDILSNFVLDFDYRRGVMWFDYRPGFVSPPFNRSGMRALKEKPDAFRVALVVPGSPAHDAGIVADDWIVAVDGIPAAQMSGRDLGRKLTQDPGTEIALNLRRGADERSANLTLVDLLP